MHHLLLLFVTITQIQVDSYHSVDNDIHYLSINKGVLKVLIYTGECWTYCHMAILVILDMSLHIHGRVAHVHVYITDIVVKDITHGWFYMCIHLGILSLCTEP